MNSFDNKKIESQIIKAKKILKEKNQDYYQNFLEIEKYIVKEVNEINNRIKNNLNIIPEIEFNSLSDDKINLEIVKQVKKRGCIIIRNVFNQEIVNKWNYDL